LLATTGSSPQFVFAVCYIATLTLMFMSAAKFYAFVIFNGLTFGLPQIVCAVAFLSSIVMVFLAQASVYGAGYGSIPSQVWRYFEMWPYCAGLSLSVLLGFYFREIATLTSAGDLVGLQKMKWPAIIVLCVLWVWVQILGGLQAVFISGSNVGGGNVAMIIMITFFSVTSALALFITSWGGFSLLQHAYNTQSFGRILFIVLTGFGSLGLVISAGLNYILGRGWFVFYGRVGYLSPLSGWILLTLFPCLFCPVAIVVILLNFTIRLNKDIELSKSGTSSTSSAGSSKSTSSSSQADPVIEL